MKRVTIAQLQEYLKVLDAPNAQIRIVSESYSFAYVSEMGFDNDIESLILYVEKEY